MTHSTDRRTALLLAMGAALAPAMASRMAVAAPADHLIAPPEAPMRYSRSVSRELIDGSFISVSRDFEVLFRRVATGFVMYGQQTDVRIEAPDVLAPFTRIEQARDESGMFPISLDVFGHITSAQIAQTAQASLRRAVQEALSDISTHPIAEDEREQVSHYLNTLQQAGQRVMAHLPTDLFAPAVLNRRDEQTIALPGGIEGIVETVFACERDSSTGLMQAASRQILTCVGQSSRTTREDWILAAI